jgi:hypothetical protein
MSEPIKQGFWKSLIKDVGVQNALAGTLVSVVVAGTKYALFRSA